jgi:hypothetical protein
MKMANLTYTFGMIMLIAMSGTVKADTNMKTAMANCREEAVSTGLEDEADITAYVDLCMQAWQSPSDYTEFNPAPDEVTEPLVEDAQEGTTQ